MKDILSLIKSRRSIRRFRKQKVPLRLISKILEAARFAPSGLNNQPWRFILIEDREIKAQLSKLTSYGFIFKNAPLLIGVFLDKKESYNFFKDTLSIGACIQNMLLEAHSLGLGTCWLGEILKEEKKIKRMFGLGPNYVLCAFVALGFPAVRPRRFRRKPLRKLILKKNVSR